MGVARAYSYFFAFISTLSLAKSAQEAPAGTRLSAQVLVNGIYWQRVIEDMPCKHAHFEALLMQCSWPKRSKIKQFFLACFVFWTLAKQDLVAARLVHQRTPTAVCQSDLAVSVNMYPRLWCCTHQRMIRANILAHLWFHFQSNSGVFLGLASKGLAKQKGKAFTGWRRTQWANGVT